LAILPRRIAETLLAFESSIRPSENIRNKEPR